jgi:hypothetical protein
LLSYEWAPHSYGFRLKGPAGIPAGWV